MNEVSFARPNREKQLASKRLILSGASLRTFVSATFRRLPYLPATIAIASYVSLLMLLRIRATILYEAGLAFVVSLASFLWGYWLQSNHRRLFPPLSHLQKRQYEETWDALALSRDSAFAAAAGWKKDEAEFSESAQAMLHNLIELVTITTRDDVLEVGCGAARIGAELASHCATWTGADISSNMLRHARVRVTGLSNVHLVHLRQAGLADLKSGSFDVVYFTNMLMHLDGMDCWNYFMEAFRVLRPGGRIYADIIDVECEKGWAMFADDAKRYIDLQRPPYMPRFFVPAELGLYFAKAGFQEIRIERRAPLAITLAVKSANED